MRKIFSSVLVGFSFGTILTASIHDSYHNPYLGWLAAISAVTGFLVGDYSGPRDPERSNNVS